jgi:DNA repair exonuclease SbcCD nuclease subunit
MKILFTADLHLKLGQKNVPVAWAKDRYRSLFNQLAELQKECDLFIVGGDTFDRVPTIEELELFFIFVNSCKIKTIVYSGNHEALKKNTTFLSNLKSIVSAVNDKVQIIDSFETIDGVDFIPYNKLKEYHPADIDFHSNILCTHVRGAIPPHVKPEIDLSLLERWSVVLAGDLHSYSNCQLNILYPGSPVTTTFHRNEVDTGVIILDTESLEHVWVKLDLPQLLRKTIKAGEETPATKYHHTIYEVEGDMSELMSVQDNELIDKKVVKRETDTALILEPTMTLEQEVSEYLKYILLLDDEVVNSVLLEMNNNAEKFI